MEIVPSNSLLLVGYMPSLKDFEIARMLGWYRIPLRFAPKIIDVDYFAFYQGSNFGEEYRWKIEYFAEYRGHELTTRGDLLRDEGNHPRAREEYYKVQLGPLVRIPAPIKSEKWKRITFLFTTGELLNRARIVNDLVISSEGKEVLWKVLKERNLSKLGYSPTEIDNFQLDPSILETIFNLGSSGTESDLDNY